MKNIFIDCGAHFGEGLKHFVEHYHINKDWDVYCFEPNKNCFPILERVLDKRIKFIKKAIWIKDGTISFNEERWIEDKWNATGPGSSIFGQDVWTTQLNVPTIKTTVESIDFSKFLSELEGNIYVKMDIEGAEYEVLRQLIKDGNIKKIKELHIEFHHNVFKSESEASTNELITHIKEAGVLITLWH